MIAAIVPAAGKSTRMGRPKLLMSLDGATLLHRVVTALRQGGWSAWSWWFLQPIRRRAP